MNGFEVSYRMLLPIIIFYASKQWWFIGGDSFFHIFDILDLFLSIIRYLTLKATHFDTN